MTLFDLPAGGFRGVLELNLMGTFYPVRVFAREMASLRRGSIVNISSMSADRLLTRIPAYSAAKAAVSNFTRWAAVYFSIAGIRVNAVSPGFFRTEQSRFLQWDPETGEPTEWIVMIIAGTPMGRFGEPGELTGTVRWLFFEASRFVTGAVVPIDGGFSSYAR